MADVILLYKRGGLIYTVRPVSYLFHVEFNVKLNDIFDNDIPHISLKNINTFTEIFYSCKTESYHLGYNHKVVASVNKIKNEFPRYELTSIPAIRNNNDKSFGIKNSNKHHKNAYDENINNESTRSRHDNKRKPININKIKQDIHQLAKDYGNVVKKNTEHKLLTEFRLK